MVWNKDSQETEYLHYRNTILVVYQVYRELYNWHVEGKDTNGRRTQFGTGQDFGRDKCKALARDFADKWIDE